MLEHGMMRGTILTPTGGSFIAGNFSGSATIDKVDVTADVAVVTIAAALVVARGGGASVASSTKAYALGGGDPVVSEIDGLNLSTEAAVNPTATLSLARGFGMFGASSISNGYGLGGRVAAPYLTEIDGIAFATETAINPAGALSYAGAYGTTRAIPIGTTAAIDVTSDGTFYTSGHKFTFSTETSAATGVILATARAYMASVWSTTNGYNMGGYNGANLSEIDGFNLSTETAINPATSLPAGERGHTGLNSTTHGLVCGGSAISAIRTFNFSTETVATRANSLANTRYFGYAFQANTI